MIKLKSVKDSLRASISNLIHNLNQTPAVDYSVRQLVYNSVWHPVSNLVLNLIKDEIND